jgi:hypothetical protein
MRPMSKSAVRVAREALAVGRNALPPYASRYSKHTYTQPQLFALLALKQFLRTDYRGLVALLAEWRGLRRALGLTRVPHYSALCYAERRLLAGAEKGDLRPRPGRHPRAGAPRGPDRPGARGRGGRHRCASTPKFGSDPTLSR